jgi:BlaI family penicillinase repressor
VKKLPPLASAELGVMQLLWDQGACSARQILEALYPDPKTPQHGTVQRLLQRLEEKGFVARDRSAAVQLFSARVTRERVFGAELESLAERMTGGSLAPVLSFLIEKKKLSREEIRRLREIVEDR